MSNIIIEVKNLRKTFEIKEKTAGFTGGLVSIFRPAIKTITAVNNISFSIDQGELLAFIGPNGAGKSTTIKMLIGILYPTDGQIKVLGLHPSEQRQRLAYHIGSVFGQRSQLWYHLPPQDTYNLLGRIYELPQDRFQKRLDFLVETFEIRHLLKIPIRKLSLGQRMRCEIVASLLHEPKVLFLDEPTIGLDVIAKQQIRKVIKYLNEKENVTIFLTSHDAGDIEALCRRTIIINQGGIVFDGATEKLKKNYIRTKIVEILSSEPLDKFRFDGGKIIERSKYGLKIELNTSLNSIDKLLSYALKDFEIEDINIFNPPMEEIIASIYRNNR